MDDEEETLQRYGTPLEPLPEDEIPSKKPISIEDQIVTDENGKRRFHGAFTGGFSAGFWNTVGSLEGWKPSEFKSSRSEKAQQRTQQKPEDFMDDEDLGEFGIAPQRIQAQNDFQIETANSSRKRKLIQSSFGTSGAIPGMPVLAELLRPVEDKIAVRILKSMGWKPGQGIGPRLTGKQKQRTRERNKREEYVLRRYGCSEESGKSDEDNVARLSAGISDDDDDNNENDDNELTFAPDDYDSLVCSSKTNRFGLGYSGLSRDISGSANQSHINLFGPLEVLDKNNKKLSIRGQAFGVGALEEEDEDIYARDDLTKYDFTLEDQKRKQKAKAQKPIQDRHIIEGFATAKHEVQYQDPYILDIPAGFQPRNWAMRKSRFAPLAPEKMREIEESISKNKKPGLGRHDLNPAQRSAILEEQTVKPTATKADAVEKRSLEELRDAQRRRDERTKNMLELISAKSSHFTRGGIINTQGEEEMTEVKNAVQQEQQSLLAKAASKTKALGSTNLDSKTFKPFLGNEAKQQRYEKFLESNLTDEAEIASYLATIQPVDLSEWDREMERKEFMQARKIYKPLRGIMTERFVSESTLSVEKSKTESNQKETKSEHPKKIVMKRNKEVWRPHALLCKRYNIAEPLGGKLDEIELNPSKRAKLTIFDYSEISVNRKDNFETPVIIPKHIEKPKAVVNNRTRDKANSISTQQIDKKSRQDAVKEPPPQPPTVLIDQKHFKLPPKTELEKRVEENRDKPPSEKVELFRAIFEDSDDELEEETQSAQLFENPNLEINKLDLPSTSKPLPAVAANLLKSNSPPRGIFSTLFNASAAVEKPKDLEISTPKNEKVIIEAPTKITFKSRSERQQANVDDDASYGPKLPAHIALSSNKSKDDTVESRLLSLFGKYKSNAVLQDVWVERTKEISERSDTDSSSESSSSSDSDNKRLKRKHKKNKKSTDKAREKKKSKKIKKKTKTKKKSKSKKKKNK